MDRCKNCHHNIELKYCSACGQKEFKVEDLTVKKFFSTAFKDFTHFDFKIFKDIPPLLFKPGFLTNEFIAGRVGTHIKPITLFLWLNVFFFLYGYTSFLPQNKFDAANYYVHGLNEKAFAHAAEKGIDTGVYIEKFNAILTGFQKSMFFFLIPAFAFLLFLLYIYKKENYYVKHLVYSIHFWCYLFVYFTVIPVLLGTVNFLYQQQTGTVLYKSFDGPLFLVISLLGIMPYTFFALRRVHQQNIPITVIKTIVITFLALNIRSWSIALSYLIAYLLT